MMIITSLVIFEGYYANLRYTVDTKEAGNLIDILINVASIWGESKAA